MQHRLRLICIKTRRNWNTAGSEATEDMPGKSLFSRSAPVCISGSCLAWNFKTYMKRYLHRKSRQGFCSRSTIGPRPAAGKQKGNTGTAGLAFGVSGRFSMAMFLCVGEGEKGEKKKGMGIVKNRPKKWIPPSRRDPFFQRISTGS